MKVRLIGSRDDCASALAVLREHLDVVRVDGPYLTRTTGAEVRLYVLARARKTSPAIGAGTPVSEMEI